MSPLACPTCASGRRCVLHGLLLDDDPYDGDFTPPQLCQDARDLFLVALDAARELAERVCREHPRTVDAARAAYLLDALPSFRAQGLRHDVDVNEEPPPTVRRGTPAAPTPGNVVEIAAYRGRRRRAAR